MSFRPYNHYGESGVEWLGDLPSHWGVVKLRSMLIEPPCYGVLVPDFDPDGVPMLRITDIDRGRAERAGLVTISDTLSRLYLRSVVQQGDVALSVVGTIGEAIKINEGLAGVNLSRAVARLRPSGKMSADFMCWMFQSIPFRRFVDLVCVGTAQRVLNMSDLSGFKLGLPSAEEQSAIAAFLDRETIKIDALVTEQLRLIELLKEKRQAIISHAVTKGLDPTAPMKDTGLEWLGQVPSHWQVGRLKYFADVRGRIGFRGYAAEDLVSEGEGALVLGGANLSERGQISLEQRTYLSWEKYDESPEIKVELGDIVVGQRGTCGRVSIVDADLGATTINPSLVVLKGIKLNPHFLLFWLMSDVVQKTFQSYLNKTAVPMLSQEQIGNVLAGAPSSEEQSAIASHLSRATEDIDRLISASETNVGLLQERRAALIFATVTGKIDVRGLVEDGEPHAEEVAA